MSELTKDQVAEIETLIAKQYAANSALSNGRKWQVALMIGAFTAFAITLLGFGGRAIVEGAARDGAKLMTDETVAQRVVTNKAFLLSVARAGPTLPPGSVLAIAQGPDSKAEEPQCPAGWRFYSEGAGRFILGAGAGQGLAPRGVGETGGEEQHVLTIREMPGHVHDYQQMVANNDIDGVDSTVEHSGEHHNEVRESSSVGGGQPHNNMPPYIALTLCQKM